MLHQVLRQRFDASESVINPHVDQESDPRVLCRSSAVVDLSRHAVQQPPVEAHVLARGGVADEGAGHAVASGNVVARVLQDNGGSANAAEVSHGANLRVHFDAVNVGECFVLVPVEPDAFACKIKVRTRIRQCRCSTAAHHLAFYLHQVP